LRNVIDQLINMLICKSEKNLPSYTTVMAPPTNIGCIRHAAE